MVWEKGRGLNRKSTDLNTTASSSVPSKVTVGGNIGALFANGVPKKPSEARNIFKQGISRKILKIKLKYSKYYQTAAKSE